jgi:hypothetical protein
LGVAVHKVHATFLPVLMVNRYYILFMVNAVAPQFYITPSFHRFLQENQISSLR